MEIKTLMAWAFIGIFFLIMTNVAFAHCVKRSFETTGKKTLWCIISLIPFFGFIIYFLLGAKKGVLKEN